MQQGAVVVPVWAVVLVAGIIMALIGFVWRDMVKRFEAMSAKLDGHVVEDAKAHERLTVLETKVEENRLKTKDVGDRLHRFMAETREAGRDLNSFLLNKFSELQMWITEKVIGK